jgi:hypothetical protein
MEYLIAISVVAIGVLYTVIVVRASTRPEW